MSGIKDFLKDMFDCFIADVLPIIVVVLIALGCMLAISVTLYKLNKSKCEKKATFQELEWHYGIEEGCMVKTENGWMDYDRLIYKKEVK